MINKLLKILFTVILLQFILFAQDDKSKNPNVELPDFVITGSEVVKLKKADKFKPDFSSTISEEFLKPTFPTEELEMKEISDPIKKDISFLDDYSFYIGYVSAGIGLYTLPKTDLLYAYPIQNGILKGTFNGFYNREYIDNADNYGLRAGFDVLYWTDINDKFLPGTELNLAGDYGTHSFKFFASDNPTEKRTVNSGKLQLNIKNEYNKTFLFGIRINNALAQISEEPFSENNFRLKAESRFTVSFVNVGIAVDYKNHRIENQLSNSFGRDIFIFRPTAGFQFTEIAKGSFGFTFSNAGGEKFNAPYASLVVKLDKSITFFGEYNPEPELTSAGEFLATNIYLDLDSLNSTYHEKSDRYKLAVKYEFDKYFQIDGGIKYFSSKEYPYFINSLESGKFSLAKAKVKSFNPFVNFLFYLGPYGEFYSSAEFNSLTDDNSKLIPYVPQFLVNAIYRYRFSNGLKTSVKLDYLLKRYADIENNLKLNDLINVGLAFVYPYKQNLDLFLELNNLTSNKNFYWYGYEQSPLDLLIGVKYKF